MKLFDAVSKVFERCKTVEGLEINFDNDVITFYWHELRIDVMPDQFERALKLIEKLQDMEARFE